MSDPHTTLGSMLTPAELLDFAATHPNRVSDDETRRTLGVTLPRYYQLLHRAAASMEGQAHDGVTAHRVLRLINAD